MWSTVYTIVVVCVL